MISPVLMSESHWGLPASEFLPALSNESKNFLIAPSPDRLRVVCELSRKAWDECYRLMLVHGTMSRKRLASFVTAATAVLNAAENATTSLKTCDRAADYLGSISRRSKYCIALLYNTHGRDAVFEMQGA